MSYKKDSVLPDTFGRDAPYDDDRTYPLVKEEQVAHIHLADADAPFPKFLRQFNEPAIRPIWYTAKVRWIPMPTC